MKVPFRPIVSGTKCPLKRMCTLAKTLLQPLEQTIDHLVKDRFDFVRKMPEKLDGDRTLVAVDIAQLYPSMSNKLGLEAIRYWCKKHLSKIIPVFDE